MKLPTSTRPGGRRTLRTLLLAGLLATSVAAVQAAGAVPAAAAAPPEVEVPGMVNLLDAVSVPGDAIYLARGTTIVRFVPGQPLQTFAVPSGLDARQLAVAPDGTVWFGGLSSSIGTVSPSGAFTTKALVSGATAGITVSSDGAVWVLSGTGALTSIQRGAPGQPMAAVPLPEGTTPSWIGPGYSGSIIAVGATDSVVAADGTVTALTGLPGFEREVTTIGGKPWVIGLNWVAEVGAGNVVTAHEVSLPASTFLSSGVEGPGGDGWAVANGDGIRDSYLARFDETGATGLTVATDTPAGASLFEASTIVADPTADRLWAVGRRSSDMRLAPIDLDKTLSAVAVDDPGSLTFGVPAAVHAQITDWDAGDGPTGTITFSHFGVVLATAPVQPDGSADATVMPTFQGLNLRASYSGDAHHAPSRSPLRYRSVATPASTLTITPPPAPWRPGTATFGVQVTSPSGAEPVGTVAIGDKTVAVSGGSTFPVPVTLALGPNTIGATFTPAEGYASASATLPAATARFESDEENYVAAAYLRLFGRMPDPSGRVYWSNKLKGGLSRDRFALQQVATTEYRRKVAKRVGLAAPNATVAQAKPVVDAMAEKTVRELLVDHWAAGKKVVNCKDTISPQFAPDGSFMCWVKMIFTTFTGSATQDDFSWANRYGNSPEGRRAIAKILVYSDTAVRPIVEAAYVNYLNRAPDPSGWTYWTKKIQGGMREEGVEARVLGSDEFWRRTLLPPSA